MNPVVDAVRKQYPDVYKDMSDDDLTLAIGSKYPDSYRDIPEFADDYNRLTNPMGRFLDQQSPDLPSSPLTPSSTEPESPIIQTELPTEMPRGSYGLPPIEAGTPTPTAVPLNLQERRWSFGETDPKYAKEHPFAAGVGEAIAGLVEFAVNDPEQAVGGLVAAPIGTALGLFYGPQIAKQALSDLHDYVVKGDERAGGRFMGLFAMVASHPTAKGLTSVAFRARDAGKFGEIYKAWVDQAARENLDPSRAQRTVRELPSPILPNNIILDEFAPQTSRELERTPESKVESGPSEPSGGIEVKEEAAPVVPVSETAKETAPLGDLVTEEPSGKERRQVVNVDPALQEEIVRAQEIVTEYWDKPSGTTGSMDEEVALEAYNKARELLIREGKMPEAPLDDQGRPVFELDKKIFDDVRREVNSAAGDRAGDFDVYWNPNERLIGPKGEAALIEAKYSGDGRLMINAALAKDLDAVRKAVREELGHELLATPDGQKALDRFMEAHPLTSDQVQKLYDSGYFPEAGETIDAYKRRLHDEFVAKQNRPEHGFLWDLADQFATFVKQTLGIELSHEQAARSILRQLRKQFPTSKKSDIVNQGSTPAGTPSQVEAGRIAGVGPASVEYLNQSGIPASPDGSLNAVNSSSRFSLRNAGEWIADLNRNKVANKIYSKEDLRNLERAILQTRKIFGDFLNVPEEVPGSPIRTNTDPLFVRTFDLSTICPRQDQYLAVIQELERERGDIYGPHQRFLIGEMMRDSGVSPACWYCYGQSGRNMFDAQIAKAAQVMNQLAIDTKGKVPSQSKISARFGTWKTEGTLADAMRKFVPEIFKKKLTIDPARVRDIARGYITTSDPFEIELVDALKGWAQGATKANKPKPFSPYTDQVLRMPQEMIDGFNRSAGFRLNSQTDIRPWHVIDTAQFLTHLKMKGGMAHVYTRVPEFVEIFGETGIKFNMSMEFAHGPDGKILRFENGVAQWNDMEGMPRSLALKFRLKNKNAGSMLVAMTEEDLIEGLNNPEVDMIIPYHRGSVPKSVEKFIGVRDFSSIQHEDWSGLTGEKKTVVLDSGRKVSIVPGEPITREHHLNSKEDYLDLTRKLGIKPRFADYVNHPGYMKLVRDVARNPSDQAVVDPMKVNWEAAEKFIQGWMEKGGVDSETKANPVVLRLIRDKIEKGEWPRSTITPPETTGQLQSGKGARYSLRPTEPSTSKVEDLPGFTVLKHAMSDLEREVLGFGKRSLSERQAMAGAWERAGVTLSNRPEAGRELVGELISNPNRGLSGDESAVLLRHKRNVLNAINSAAERTLAATDPEKKVAAGLDVARYEDELRVMLDAVEKRGTSAGREFRWRQALAFESYDFVSQERLLRVAYGDKPIPSDVIEQLRKDCELYRQRAEELERVTEKAKAEAQKAQADLALANIKTQEAEARSVPSHILTLVNRAREAVRKGADESRFRLKGALFTLSPQVMFDLARVGADNFWEIGEDFAKWSEKMVLDIGEKVRPHLADVWEPSKRMAAQVYADIGGKDWDKIKKTIIRPNQKDSQEKIVAALKQASSEGLKPGELGDFTKAIVRTVVKSGIEGFDEVFAETWKIMRDAGVELQTVDDVIQAFSDYGISQPAPSDPIKIRLAQLRGEGQKHLGLRTILEERKRPLPTGQRRVEPSDLYRRTVQQINEALKRLPPEERDSGSRLASWLDARKTYRRNRIKDLRYEMSTGERIVKNKVVPLTDEELLGLEREYNELKREHDAMFPKQPMTDEQRLAAESKSLDREIAKLEKDIASGNVLPKDKKARPTTPEIQAKKARLNMLREERNYFRDLNEEFQRRRETIRVERRKAALLRLIDRKLERLAKGDISTSSGKVNRPEGPETEPLRQRLDELNRQLHDLRNPEKTREEIIARRKENLQKLLDKKREQLASGDVATKGRLVNRPEVPELEPLLQALDEANRKLNELRHPKKTSEEIYNQGIITRVAKQIADLEDRMARGDFEKRVRPPRPRVNEEAQKAQAALNEVKTRFLQRKAIADEAKKGTTQKAIELVLVRLKRASVLAWPTIFGKLTAAAGWGMLVAPMEGALGGLIGHVMPRQVRSRALRYGRGTSLDAEVRAIADTVTKAIINFKEAATTGSIEIDRIYGKPDIAPSRWDDYVGFMHYALKSHLMQNEWSRSFRVLLENKARDGINVSDPEIIKQTGFEAYRYATERLFMEPNMITDAYRRALGRLSAPKKETGRPSALGIVAKSAIKFELPIVSIPTNIVKRAFEYFPLGGYGAGAFRLIRAIARGIEDLPAEEADLIIRNFSRGTVGMAFFLYGWFNYENVGGYYHKGDRRRKDDVKYGGLRIGGHEVPRIFLHNPLLEQIQIGATMHKVANASFNRGSGYVDGLSDGAFAGLMGLVEEAPFAGEIKRSAESMTDMKKAVGEAGRSLVPGFVQWIARRMDTEEGDFFTGTPVQRTPETIADEMRMAIPGMRQDVPRKRAR